MNKKRLRNTVSILLCLLCVLLVPVFSSAKESKTVRVGWYADVYNNIGNDGNRSGYAYEYQQTVANYTGWTYEYTEAEWSDLIQMIQDGELDLLGGVSYTEERSKSMLFSDLPMGEEKYYIYADLMNTDISTSDLESLNGKTIGFLEDSVQSKYLQEWEEKNNIRFKKVYVDDFEDAYEKIKAHEIDCVISTENPDWVKAGLSAVTMIGSSDIYFVMNKDAMDLKKELDAAMQKLQMENPFYADDLYKQYLSSEKVEALSKEEQDWLGQHGKIRIGYLNDDSGVSVLDEKTGRMDGVINDYVTRAENCLQNASLEFELVGYETIEEQLQALKDKKIDMIFHTSQNPNAAEKNGYILSNTVWSFNLAAITTKDYFDEESEVTVAVEKENIALKQYISYNYPQWKIKEYDTEDEVEKAVKEKKADCFVLRSARVERYVTDGKYHSIFLMKPGNTSFAVLKENTVLLSILNKTLLTMPTTLFNGAVSMYDKASEKITLKSFLADNMQTVTISVMIIISCVLVIVLYLLRKANQAKEHAEELNEELEKQHRELELALQKAESANIAKTTFLNNMSHDIRTPINGIVGMLSIIRKSSDNPEKVEECLDKIDISSKLLLSLVNDVLDMAKLETDAFVLSPESVNLDRVCDEVTNSVVFQAETAGIQVTSEHDDYTEVNVFTSPLHLKKILMNLFTNSIKYNKTNGSIHVSMKTLEKTDSTITCEFQIEDTGIGMSEDFIEHDLFTPFVQAGDSARSNYSGTGLGMPIVKELVEKMGGSITVESKLGKGSRFTVILPFQLDYEGERHSEQEPSHISIEGVHILLAEDNKMNAEIAQFMLQDSGVQVDIVENGKAAVETFEASEAGVYDVILMDVMMPIMDGLAATKAIRALDRPDAGVIPIIAMTANAFKEDKENSYAAGMNAHLTKPLDMDVLKETICMVLRKDKSEKGE